MSPPFRVVCAPDSFKGSLSAPEAAAALAVGVRLADPSAVAVEHPVADGGEGTATALVAALGGSWQPVTTVGPLGRPLEASYGLLPDQKTAVVELAAASGLTLLAPSERDPLRTSTLGTGQLLKHALSQGMHVILGVGGSATVDGGAGLLAALGARLLDSEGLVVPPSGSGLEGISAVDLSGIPADWRGRIRVACDVDSPLLGPQGAAAVFAPQKGASAQGVEQLERGLRRWAGVLAAACGHECPTTTPGAGAAGGVPFALVSALGAELTSGSSLVLEVTDFAAAIQGAQLCLTGEGRIDGQTSRGKAPWAVASACRGAGVPVVAIAGALGPEASTLTGPEGFDAVFSAQRSPSTLAAALDSAAELLASAAEQVVRLAHAVGRSSPLE